MSHRARRLAIPLLFVSAAALCVSPASAQRGSNDDEDAVIRPPAIEPPGDSSSLIPLGVVVLGLVLTVAPAVIPSKRAHGE